MFDIQAKIEIQSSRKIWAITRGIISQKKAPNDEDDGFVRQVFKNICNIYALGFLKQTNKSISTRRKEMEEQKVKWESHSSQLQ